MKAQFLKMAGVKSEKEFYKKFPTKESFFAKYGAQIKKAQMGITSSTFDTVKSGFDAAKNVQNNEKFQKVLGQLGGMDLGSQVMDTIDDFKARKQAMQEAEQTSTVMGYMEDAAVSNKQNQQFDLQDARMKTYVRPEDNTMVGESLFPVNGVGTNVLARKGKTIPKAMFGLNAESMGALKQFGMNQASSFADKALGKMGFGDDAGSRLGGKLGGIASTVTGIPGLDKVGTVIGDVLDRSDDFIKKHQNKSLHSFQNMTGIKHGDYLQRQFSQSMQNGGTVSGEGGNILIHDDEASLTPISNNPYGGETHMINGPSHKEGGVNMSVYGNPIEAEGNEPIQKNSNGDISIMGNLEVPSHIKKSAQAFLGEKFSGNKFKTFSKSIGQAEDKLNKDIAKNTSKAEKYTPLNKLDRISLNTLKTNIDLADKKLQKFQTVKDGLAEIQDVMAEGNQYAKNGKRIYAQENAKVKEPPKKTYKTLEEAEADGYELVDGKLRRVEKEGTPAQTITEYVPDEIIEDTTATAIDNSYKVKGGKSDVTVQDILNNRNKYKTFHSRMGGAPKEEVEKAAQILYEKGIMPSQYVPPKEQGESEQTWREETFTTEGTPTEYSYAEIEPEVEPIEGEPKKKNKLGDFLNRFPSLLRSSDAEGFNPAQLLPEAWALANNKLEPVQAQKFNPRYRVPFDISLQDSKNDVIANSRAMQRMIADNPELAGSLHAETATGLNKINAEEFRLNQQFKDQIYSGNYNTYNDAQLKNLEIADKQYVRQEQAKSNTKATELEALKSATDKRMQHALENKTLKIWENMYDYRYGNSGIARYMGPNADFDNWKHTPLNNSNTNTSTKDYEYEYDEKTGKKTRQKVRDYVPNWNPNAARYVKNGTIVKKLKNFK